MKRFLVVLAIMFFLMPAKASDVKSKYGTQGVAITCTVASLANAAARSCAAVDNETNVYLDALVQIKITSAAAATSSSGYINVYAYGTVDGGTSYPEGAGADGAVTLTVPPNVRLIGRLNVVANSTTYVSEPFAVSPAFSGVLPDNWGIIIENQTGAALDADAGDHFVKYQGVYAQVN